MPLFSYKVVLDDGEEKSGKVTAKTVDAARKRVSEENKIGKWLSCEEVPVQKPVKAPPVASPLPKATKSAVATKLEKLLFLQSSKCFFCSRVLTKADASVEHLVATSNGGTNADDNVVACCRTLNGVFGNIALKEKIRIILEQSGKFQCPKT